jgi:predicted ATPase
MVQQADVLADPVQLQALQSLERLYQDLLTTEPPALEKKKDKPAASSGTMLTGLWGKPSWMGATTTTEKKKRLTTATTTAPIGVYLHGGVGCGKTFLMNQVFGDCVAQSDTAWAAELHKTHFHKFLLRIHQEMHAARYNRNNNSLSLSSSDNEHLFRTVIDSVVQSGRLLLFDEFQVTDVADALILQRLFTGLWDRGCVVVATSNRPPDDLYKQGLQRDRFLPFIHLLKKKCEVVSMWESDTDYRLIHKKKKKRSSKGPKTKQAANDDGRTAEADETTTITTEYNELLEEEPNTVYFVGGKEARKEWKRLFYALVGSSAVAPTSLQTQGRRVAIPLASLSKGIAKFTFEDLCQKALGAADYLVLGQHFHTVFVERIPVLTMAEINWVRRFITFVDAMYECHVKLILHAAVEADHIFQVGEDKEELAQHHDEVFAFDRTVSRLQEMASDKYLRKRATAKSSRTVHEVEPAAELLSKSKAVVNVVPSLGDGGRGTCNPKYR